MSQGIDTRYQVNTPEGVALYLAPAGVVPRFLAWSIDLLVRLIINGVVAIALIILLGSGLGAGLGLIFSFLLEWFYPVYFELRKEGQTPGKKSMGLYVAHEDATPINFSSSMIRNLLRVVDFLPFLYAFGLISMLLSRRFQRLGDRVARTVVLHKPVLMPTVDSNSTHVIRPTVKLTLVEQQALVAFLQRNRTISLARQNELAQLVEPLVDNSPQPVDHLLGIANHLTGSKQS